MIDKKIYIITPNFGTDHFSNLKINIDQFEETLLLEQFSIYDDFNANTIVKNDIVHLLPKNSIKLFYNFCHFPEKFTEIWIDKESINTINQDPNSYLWLFSPHESWIEPYTIQNLLDKLSKHNIPFNKVIFTNGNSQIDGKILNGIKCISILDWHEASFRWQFLKFDDISYLSPHERKESFNDISKKCICLNRNLKKHRVWTYQNLLDTELFNDSYISYHLPTIAAEEGYSAEQFKAWIANECKFFNKKILKDKRLYQSKKLDDLGKFEINNQTSIKRFYKDSLISLVTESHSEYPFVTEKTFKSILHCQPFIIVGTGYNSELKNRGYETFEDLFNLDEIKNTSDLCIFIQTMNCNNLSTLKNKIINEHWHKIVHNWNHFLNRKISFRNFEQKILKELL